LRFACSVDAAETSCSSSVTIYLTPCHFSTSHASELFRFTGKTWGLASHLDRLRDRAGLGGTEFSKICQSHKFYCSDEVLKRWERILYVDAGVRINHPILSVFIVEQVSSITRNSVKDQAT
jgi:hypothetical protein